MSDLDDCGCTGHHPQPPEFERAEDEPGLISRREARLAYEAVDRTWMQSRERALLDDHLRSNARAGRSARAVARVQLLRDRSERGSAARYKRAVVQRLSDYEVWTTQEEIRRAYWSERPCAGELRRATNMAKCVRKAAEKCRRILARLEGQ